MCLLAVLAGCAAPGPSSTPSTPAPSASVPEPDLGPVATQNGCSSYYAQTSVPMAWAREHLPPGFEPYAAENGALFTSKAWTCASSASENASRAWGPTILYYLGVTPPVALQDANLTFYWYLLAILTSDEGAALFHEWGFSVASAATVTFDPWSNGPAPHAQVEASDGTTRVSFFAATPTRFTEGAFTVRYFGDVNATSARALDIRVEAGDRAGGGVSRLAIEGPTSPGPENARTGTASFQGWAPSELSYTWTPRYLALNATS